MSARPATHRGPGGGRPRWWLVALGLVVTVVGGGQWLLQGPGPEVAPSEGGPSSASGPASSEEPQPEVPEAVSAPARPGAPDRILIPDLGVDSPVVAIKAPGGVLTPPSDPQTLGWWADGARPGARRGSALLTGHTVSTGGGALDDLEELAAGSDVRVRSGRRATRYVVESTEVLGKGELAAQSEQLFDQSVPGRLVLITCEDWNGVEYLSNVVVTATPGGSPA